jgi:hypothetical protein
MLCKNHIQRNIVCLIKWEWFRKESFFLNNYYSKGIFLNCFEKMSKPFCGFCSLITRISFTDVFLFLCIWFPLLEYFYLKKPTNPYTCLREWLSLIIKLKWCCNLCIKIVNVLYSVTLVSSGLSWDVSLGGKAYHAYLHCSFWCFS